MSCGSVAEGYDASYCEGGVPQLAVGLNPAEDVDHVGVYRSSEMESDGTSTELTGPVEVQSEGVACATGSAPCQEAMMTPQRSSISTNYDFGISTTEYAYLASTQGDEARFHLSEEEVCAFLGTIDSPSEASLLAYLAGYNLGCSDERNNISETAEGYVVYAETGHGCGAGADVIGYRLLVTPEGNVEIENQQVVEKGDPGCAIGRLPGGLCTKGAEGDSLGAFFARIAHLEAASVASFEQLAEDLRRHEAPETLIGSAELAAREEKRHAIVMRALSRRFGHEGVTQPVIQRPEPRCLEELAIENAVEGLIREAFGALLAHHQALHAESADVRATLALVAKDETRHAAFSLELHQWLLPRLSTDARDRVQTARAAALLRGEALLCTEPSEEQQRLAGLPPQDEARRMYRALQEQMV